jgi:hypothetical protein
MTMTRINDNGTDRDMTKTELAEYEAWSAIAQAEAKAAADAQADKAAARQAVLDKLGLTANEAAALLG